MATQADIMTSPARKTKALAGFPPGSLTFDWIMAILAALLVGGLYLDGWAHAHGRVDNTFFTPWHAILYSTFALSAIILALVTGRNYLKGYAWWRSLPRGYLLSLIGALVFAFGGVFDLVWHSVFGFEVNLETLLSPSHLILAAGGLLIMSGPLRSVWWRISDPNTNLKSGWRNLGPLVVSSFAVFAVLSFFTQFTHPLGRVDAAKTDSPTPQGAIYSMNLDGTGQTRLTITPGKYSWFGAASPMGDKIAYSSGSGDQGDIYVANADGSNPVQLTKIAGANWYPSWSPDGKQIAFISQKNGTTAIYITDVAGGTPKALTSSSAAKWGTTWTPDGKQIAFTLEGKGIYLANVSGGDPVLSPSTESGDSGPVWSSDGTRIAFTRESDGATHIAVMNADGSDLKLIAEKSSNPVWLPDNRIAFVTSRVSDTQEIYVMNADGSNPVNLTNNPGFSSFLPTVAAKTNKIIYTGLGLESRPSWLTERAGTAAILFQAALMMGFILLLVRRWQLPFGAIALIVGLTSLLLTTNTDLYSYTPGAIIAALFADVLLQALKPSAEKPGRFYLFAFLVPVIFYAAYFLTIVLTTAGISWTIHLWLGTIILAGVVGLLISFLLVSPFNEQAGHTAGVFD